MPLSASEGKSEKSVAIAVKNASVFVLGVARKAKTTAYLKAGKALIVTEVITPKVEPPP